MIKRSWVYRYPGYPGSQATLIEVYSTHIAQLGLLLPGLPVSQATLIEVYSTHIAQLGVPLPGLPAGS